MILLQRAGKHTLDMGHVQKLCCSFWKNGEVTGLVVGKKYFLAFLLYDLHGSDACLPNISQKSPFLMPPSKEKAGTLIWVGLSERGGGVRTRPEQDGWVSKIHSAFSSVVQDYLALNSEGSQANKSLFMSNFLNN